MRKTFINRALEHPFLYNRWILILEKVPKCRSSMEDCTYKCTYIQLQYNMHTETYCTDQQQFTNWPFP